MQSVGLRVETFCVVHFKLVALTWILPPSFIEYYCNVVIWGEYIGNVNSPCIICTVHLLSTFFLSYLLCMMQRQQTNWAISCCTSLRCVLIKLFYDKCEAIIQYTKPLGSVIPFLHHYWIGNSGMKCGEYVDFHPAKNRLPELQTELRM